MNNTFLNEIKEDQLFFPTSVRATRGLTRSVILDLQFNKLFLVPNDLVDLVEFCKNRRIGLVVEYFDNDKIIESYLRFILDNNLAVLLPKGVSLTPNCQESRFESPYLFSSGIIDYDENSKYCIYSATQKFIDAKCQHVQYRLYSGVKGISLDKLLGLFENVDVKSLELYIKYSDELEKDTLYKIARKYLRLCSIIVFSSPYTGSYDFKDVSVKLVYTEKNIDNEKSCGNIGMGYFAINQEMYQESRDSNSCLNGKISIDVNGCIKNCPSLSESYGYIDSIESLESVDLEGLQKLWGIVKPMVDVCKTCEFRDVCTDCRAYIEDHENILSKPLKCGYNPKTASWSEWKSDISKHKMIDFYEI